MEPHVKNKCPGTDGARPGHGQARWGGLTWAGYHTRRLVRTSWRAVACGERDTIPTPLRPGQAGAWVRATGEPTGGFEPST